MRIRNLLTCAALVLLSACAPRPGPLVEQYQGLAAPEGTVHIIEAVDGLIVGHRLMAAGEYEVALKAYTRAAAQHGMTIDVLSAIGSANLRLGRLRQAEKLLKLATKEDEKFVPAWNNLGVVYASQGRDGEAERVFRLAFALDSGNSAEIRANLTKAIAKLDNTQYSITQEDPREYELVRRGNGRYMLLSTPEEL